MKKNTRRNFIRNSTFGLVALSSGVFAFADKKKRSNITQLFKGGVRYTDVKRIIEESFPIIHENCILVKVKCSRKNNTHSESAKEFIERSQQIKVQGSKVHDMFVTKSFDVAHYNYLEYMNLLRIELGSISTFIEKRNSSNEKEVNFFCTSDMGRNNYFNDLNEVGELSGLDHDGEGSDETFALFYTNSKKINLGNLESEIVYQEDLFEYFEHLIGKNSFSNTSKTKNIFDNMA
jgi:hypothetical protein